MIHNTNYMDSDYDDDIPPDPPTPYDIERTRNTWVNLTVEYLKCFSSFHPLNSKQRVRITESFIAELYHYAPGAYYTGILCAENQRAVWAGIIMYPIRQPKQ